MAAPLLQQGIMASSRAAAPATGQPGAPVETGGDRPYISREIDQSISDWYNSLPDPRALVLGQFALPLMSALQLGGKEEVQPDPYTNPGLTINAADFLPNVQESRISGGTIGPDADEIEKTRREIERLSRPGGFRPAPPPEPNPGFDPPQIDTSPLVYPEAEKMKPLPGFLPTEQLPNIMSMAVKEKGGNWLPGEVDDLLKVIKYDANLRNPGYLSLEDAIAREEGALQDTQPDSESRAIIQDNLKRLYSDRALESWVDTKLRKYIQTDMGTIDDPVLKVLDKYKGSVAPAKDPVFDPENSQQIKRTQKAEAARERVGIGSLFEDRPSVPEMEVMASRERTAKAEKEKMPTAAQYYEDNVDTLINSWPLIETAERHIRELEANAEAGLGSPAPEWMKNLPPSTRIHSFWEPRVRYRLEQGERDRDWDFAEEPGDYRKHTLPEIGLLIDNLRRSMYDKLGQDVPGSADEMELPEALQLTEEQLQGMSVPDAMKHAVKVSSWLKKNKSKEDLKNPVYATVKTYPENGFTWKRIGPSTETGEPNTLRNIRKALKYEGSKLSHCIGKDAMGYCDAVLNGNEEIFTLRNSENEPKVTIEVETSVPEDVLGDLLEQAAQDFAGQGRETISSSYRMSVDRWAAQNPDKLERKIKQIKGLANSKPQDKYIEYVQDFIMNSPYRIDEIVGDLEYSDMVPVNSLSDEERGTFFAKNPEFVGDYIPKQMLGYAKGGLVTKNGCSSGLCAADFLPK